MLITIGEYVEYKQPYIWRLICRRFGLSFGPSSATVSLTTREAERLMRHDAHKRVRGAIRQVRWA